MDPFEVRMQFLTLLKRLDASQGSIQKIVGYALKYFSRCGDDLWECIVEECQKGSLNMRINILYMLDNLCEASRTHQAQGPSASSQLQPSTSVHPKSYAQYVARDLGKIVQLVVPDARGGLVNLMSTRQILDSWRTKRILEPSLVDEILHTLEEREDHLHRDLSASASSSTNTNDPHSNSNSSTGTGTGTELPKNEILRRFEEDRERHKLLRQKRWHVPVPQAAQAAQASNVNAFTAIQPQLHHLSSALTLHPPIPVPVPVPAPGSTSTSDPGPGPKPTESVSASASKPETKKPSSDEGAEEAALGADADADTSMTSLDAPPPPSTTSPSIPPTQPQSQSTIQPSYPSEPQGPESALDIEFENAWETTSDWNEDDEEAVEEENFLCFGGTAPGSFDVGLKEEGLEGKDGMGSVGEGAMGGEMELEAIPGLGSFAAAAAGTPPVAVAAANQNVIPNLNEYSNPMLNANSIHSSSSSSSPFPSVPVPLAVPPPNGHVRSGTPNTNMNMYPPPSVRSASASASYTPPIQQQSQSQPYRPPPPRRDYPAPIPPPLVSRFNNTPPVSSIPVPQGYATSSYPQHPPPAPPSNSYGIGVGTPPPQALPGQGGYAPQTWDYSNAQQNGAGANAYAYDPHQPTLPLSHPQHQHHPPPRQWGTAPPVGTYGGPGPGRAQQQGWRDVNGNINGGWQ